MEKICVAVRVRPASKSEQSSTEETMRWKVEDGNRISLYRNHGSPVPGVSYVFDHVFDESCTNARVYELLTKDIVHAAVEGFNGTAFAYGQTSSGKTFTMKGSETDPGIIHRAVKDVFERIEMISNREFLIRVSYMEIYNEEINDLLAVENRKLLIHESLEGRIFVSGLREELVNSADQVLKLIESGEEIRHFGETNMNARSSRSHTVFRMVIESKGKDINPFDDCFHSDAIRVSVLNLVDLAGSERIAKTGAGGERLKEGKYINKSLMILGNVINKLSEDSKQRGHIPYRDSKLTRILQPSLGGNAKTSIICTIAPEEDHIEESKGTVQFASRAKSITNCAQVNEIFTDAALLKRQKLEIEDLRRKLKESRVLDQENERLRNEMLKSELEHEKLETQLAEERRLRKEREECIKEQQLKIEYLTNLVSVSNRDENQSEEQGLMNGRHEEQCEDTDVVDIFGTPSFQSAPRAFVAARLKNPRLSEYSPVRDSFCDVADEDMWMKMNKGYVTNLDAVQMTPATKDLSFLSHCPTTVSQVTQLVPAASGCLLFQTKHDDLMVQKEQTAREMSEVEQRVDSTQEIPRELLEFVASYRDIYKDISLKAKIFHSNGDLPTAKLLSITTEIGMELLAILEPHLSKSDGHKRISGDCYSVDEQLERLRETQNAVKYLVLDERANNQRFSRSKKVNCWLQLFTLSSIIVVSFILFLGCLLSVFRSILS